MKKFFMVLGVCLVAAMVVLSCSPDNKGKKYHKSDDDNWEVDPNAPYINVAIDGNFSEWDTLTVATADGKYLICEENTNAQKNGILRVKLASDSDYIYLYAELNYENIAVVDVGEPIGLTDSNTGWPVLADGSRSTPGPLWVWLDVDGDESGAVSVCPDSDGLDFWNYFGFDTPLQYYFAMDGTTAKMVFGWQQVNYPMDGSDYLTNYSDLWGREFEPGEGWDSDTDFSATGADGIAFSESVEVAVDPATGEEVPVIRLELRMDRTGLTYYTERIARKAVIGVYYENVGSVPAEHSGAPWSGKIPSGDTPLTLRLRK